MQRILLLVAFLILGACSSPLELRDVKKTNCVKCHEVDPDKVNVHLIPHSHDDVGWLKTVDQYFYGLNNSIQAAGVQYIISTVVQALNENPDRRFIQVETAFFWKWWKTQNDEMKSNFTRLVQNGQIEMVNGAWSMNDEACTNYQSTIDQFTWGLRILNETLGSCGLPTVGWQIDPFGHSREQASILAQMGYDGIFFARLDQNDRKTRESDKSMDFVWQGSADLENSEIFAGIFPTSIYYPPNDFCWDVDCSDNGIDDDVNSTSYNLDDKVNEFVALIKNYTAYYPTNNLVIPMGGDFQYMSAEVNFLNMDRFIKAFQNHSQLNVIYSTPSCYISAVHDAQPNLKLKTDDFFPYSSDDHSYWAGYYTSRPNFKRYERVGHNILQVAKQLASLAIAANATENSDEHLTYLREAMGVAQHHDAITGTEKQHVFKDYVRQLARGIEIAEEPFGRILAKLLQRQDNTSVDLALTSCPLANMSICSISQRSSSFLVAVYNPLSWPVDYQVRLPVDSSSFAITGPEGNVIYDTTASFNFSYVKLNQTVSSQDLVFTASSVPAMGVKLYYVQNTTKTENKTNVEAAQDDWTFGTNETNFSIDNKTNLLKSVTMNGKTLTISQQFFYYNSSNGTEKTDASGAYIFRPEGVAINFGSPKIDVKTKGNLVHEVHQVFNDWITQIIRVYKTGDSYIEFDWLVGPIDVSDYNGKEIITRFTIAGVSNDVFYTDSNGREMLQRKLNTRLDYTYNSTVEPIASNYYPVTSKIVVKDDKTDLEVAILNDRSQGGYSSGGDVELMVHRRLMKDDNKGVSEVLNETEFGQGLVTRGQYYLVLGSLSKANPDGKTTAAQERILAQKKLLQPWVGLADAKSMSLDDLNNTFNLNYSALTQSLPENINILTLEPWKDSSYLLRLEHVLEQNEDSTLSKATAVDLSDIFSNQTITEITETTLAANHLIGEKARYTWNHTADSAPTAMASAFTEDVDLKNVTLAPMQIRTFIVKLEGKSLTGFGEVVRPACVLLVGALVWQALLS